MIHLYRCITWSTPSSLTWPTVSISEARTFNISGVSSKLFSGKYEDDEEEIGDIVLILPVLHMYTSLHVESCFLGLFHQYICAYTSSSRLVIGPWSNKKSDLKIEEGSSPGQLVVNGRTVQVKFILSQMSCHKAGHNCPGVH